MNDVTWVNDLERGGVMEFDGRRQYLEVEDSDALSVEGPITISAWANFATFDTWNGIVTKGGVVHSNYPAPYDVYTMQGGDGRVSFYAGGDDAIAQVFSEYAPDLETWQHIAVTWNEDGDVTHYLNGESLRRRFYRHGGDAAGRRRTCRCTSALARILSPT